MANLKGHVVSHTHWDRAWYWPFEETRTRLVDLLDDLLELMRREPRYRHFVLDGQLAMIEDYLAIRPERRDELARLTRAGRLLVGPFFVLPDLFIPSGESLVRNLERGRRLARELGPVMPVGYLPDPFGHPAQLPQVLAGFGLEGMVFARGMGDEGERLGSDFIWEAPDGSSVLATHQELGGGYCNFAKLGGGAPTREERIEAATLLTRQRAAQMARYCPHGHLLLNNGCDHLPPQPELPDLLEAVNRARVGVRLAHSTPTAYQAAVRAAIRNGRFRPRRFRGELRGSRYANLLSGVLSARVDLKLAHHAVEVELLRWSEPLLGLARALGRGRDDGALLDEAWRLLLLCQPHDDICGCSIDPVHDDDRNRLARAAQIAGRISERAMKAILGPPAPLPGATVLNPHPWASRRVVFLPGWRGGASAETGELLRTQRVDGGTLVEAPLPPLGALVLAPSQARRPGRAGEVAVSAGPTGKGLRLENELIRVDLLRSGELRLHDRRGGPPCTLTLLDEGDAGDTYDFSPPRQQRVVRGAAKVRAQLLEAGPLRALAELRLELWLPEALSADRRSRSPRLRSLPVRLRASVSAGSPLCELELWLDNTVDEHRLRAAVSLPIAARDILCGAPFQVVRRPVEVPARPGWRQPPSPTFPVHGFVAVEEEGRGLAVLAPGLREGEARRRGGRLELLVTLLRSVPWLSRADLRTRKDDAGPAIHVEGARQLGPLALRLGLLPYRGGFAASVPRTVEELAAPPRVAPAAEPAGVRSFLAVEPASVALTSLRPAGSRRLQVRLLNLESRGVRARLLGPLRRARRLRLDGKPLGGRVDLSDLRLRPGELMTLEVELVG